MFIVSKILYSFVIIFCLPVSLYAFCFEEAGYEYRIHPAILKAIAEVESNMNPYAVNFNKNGTYDYGLMQINSSWYYVLGHKRWKKLSDPCYNVKVAAWILTQCINKYGYKWEAVGCYNAVSKYKRIKYVKKIMERVSREGT